MTEMDEDIKRTLRSIIEFVGADIRYIEYAQLQTWLEQLIVRHAHKGRGEMKHKQEVVE